MLMIHARRALLSAALFSGALSSLAQYEVVFLNPSGTTYATCNGASNGEQVGSAVVNGAEHAFVWHGTAESGVDIHPDAHGIWDGRYTWSRALAAHDGEFAGCAHFVGYDLSYIDLTSAIAWHGSSGEYVDLEGPPTSTYPDVYMATGIYDGKVVGHYNDRWNMYYDVARMWDIQAAKKWDLANWKTLGSAALGIWGDTQVGWDAGQTQPVACLWHGTKESRVYLASTVSHEPSYATGVWNNTQVGYGSVIAADPAHALLWHGTAESQVDLNPPFATSSKAYGVADNTIVGVSDDHATLWHGTAASALDLQQFLPDYGVGWTSQATAIDDVTGDIVGTAKYGNKTYAVLWRAPSGQDLAPESQVFDTGKVTSGGLASLATSDGDQETVCKFTVPNSQSPIVRFTCGFTSPFEQLQGAGFATTVKMGPAGLLLLRAYLYNWATQQDDLVLPDTRLRLRLSYFGAMAPGQPNDYVGPDRAMKCTVEVRQTGPGAVQQPCVQFDSVNIRVSGQ